MQCKDTGIVYAATSHVGTSPQPQNRLVNSQNKMHRDSRANSPSAAFFTSFLASLPMKCLRQGETGSIPWNHWYEKTEISQPMTASGASSSPQTETPLTREPPSRGRGHCHRQLGPSQGKQLLPAHCPYRGSEERKPLGAKSTAEEGVKEMRGWRELWLHTPLVFMRTLND